MIRQLLSDLPNSCSPVGTRVIPITKLAEKRTFCTKYHGSDNVESLQSLLSTGREGRYPGKAPSPHVQGFLRTLNRSLKLNLD
jgi:hypothetical protein